MDREARRSGKLTLPKAGDHRTAAQVDRDRILYSEYFRRLERVTQVASAADGEHCHNRLIHSLKVAQVARRLAERLHAEFADASINPDVVEAAALAHDLGHPPFGHVAEHQLDKSACEWGLRDGFEGNAQSFRILTRLAVHRKESSDGLDLTRATLRASLKYPWVRGQDEGTKEYAKFGVYDEDADTYAWVDESRAPAQSLEAQIMDFADDVTFSVHDIEDFFRAGLIPIERLINEPAYRNRFVDRVRRRKPDVGAYLDSNTNFVALESLLGYMIDAGADGFHGWRTQEAMLAEFRSAAITNFLQSVSLHQTAEGFALDVPGPIEMQQAALKQLIWDYVILNPRLAQQQTGQKRIVRTLFEFFAKSLGISKGEDDCGPIKAEMFPPAMAGLIDPTWKRLQRLRFAVDAVASLTESEAIRIFHKVEGTTLGSALGPS